MAKLRGRADTFLDVITKHKRVKDVLKELGCTTPTAVQSLNPDFLKNIPNIGARTINEIKAIQHKLMTRKNQTLEKHVFGDIQDLKLDLHTKVRFALDRFRVKQRRLYGGATAAYRENATFSKFCQLGQGELAALDGVGKKCIEEHLKLKAAFEKATSALDATRNVKLCPLGKSIYKELKAQKMSAETSMKTATTREQALADAKEALTSAIAKASGSDKSKRLKLYEIWKGRCEYVHDPKLKKYRQKKTLQELADDLGISRERVRQLEAVVVKQFINDMENIPTSSATYFKDLCTLSSSKNLWIQEDFKKLADGELPYHLLLYIGLEKVCFKDRTLLSRNGVIHWVDKETESELYAATSAKKAASILNCREVDLPAYVSTGALEEKEGEYRIALDWITGVPNKAYRVLLDAGKPLHREELKRLIKSSEGVANRLSADDRFVCLGRNGLWGLKELGAKTQTLQEHILKVMGKKLLTTKEIHTAVIKTRKKVNLNSLRSTLFAREQQLWGKTHDARWGALTEHDPKAFKPLNKQTKFYTPVEIDAILKKAFRAPKTIEAGAAEIAADTNTSKKQAQQWASTSKNLTKNNKEGQELYTYRQVVAPSKNKTEKVMEFVKNSIKEKGPTALTDLYKDLPYKDVAKATFYRIIAQGPYRKVKHGRKVKIKLM